jgi:hypothetical protein
MRKIDKKLNLQKANLLAENRYLESKGFGMEGFAPQEESMGMPEESYMEEMAVKKPSAQANNMIKMISTFTNTTPEMGDGDVKFTNENGETVFLVSSQNGVVSLLPPDEINRIFKEKLNQLLAFL